MSVFDFFPHTGAGGAGSAVVLEAAVAGNQQHFCVVWYSYSVEIWSGRVRRSPVKKRGNGCCRDCHLDKS